VATGRPDSVYGSVIVEYKFLWVYAGPGPGHRHQRRLSDGAWRFGEMSQACGSSGAEPESQP